VKTDSETVVLLCKCRPIKIFGELKAFLYTVSSFLKQKHYEWMHFWRESKEIVIYRVMLRGNPHIEVIEGISSQGIPGYKKPQLAPRVEAYTQKNIVFYAETGR
jgi:hypothetical protein